MIRKATLTLFAALLAGAAYAETNIAIVDFQAVIAKSQKARLSLGKVGAFRKEKQEELQNLSDQFDAKQGDAQARAATMGEAERRETAAQLQRMQTELKRKTEDAEREVDQRTTAALSELDKALGPLVKAMAEEKNIQLVLQYGADIGIVFVDESIDITDEIVSRFDAMP
jgi:Skp family chaperone for outer membrane proteins